MRLIDVEKVIHEYYKNPSYQQLCRVLNEAPTEEAIPISWMNDYMFHMGNIFGPMDISTMIRKYKEGFTPSVPEKGPVK